MADNLRIRIGNFVLPVVTGTDASGTPRAFLGHPVKGSKLVYRDFGEAVRRVDTVLDQNRHVVAQVRPLVGGGRSGKPALYAVAVARRLS